MKPPHSKPQKLRVRKLKPLAKLEPQHHPPPEQLRIKPRWDNGVALDRQRRELSQLRDLMATAVAARQLKSVEAIMEQLLMMVEREDGGRGSREEEAFRGQVIEYLEQCEVDLKALVEQEEAERKRQRFHGNELMRHAMELLHASPVDEQVATKVLEQAEQAYRRAHDRRAECIAGIRHKVAADARLSEAARRFDACEITAAITIARSASEQYAAYRTSPTYQGSQILLSLSEPTDLWDEKPIRELSHSNDGLDRCFQDVAAYFQDKARAKAKSLYQESKRLVGECRCADARDALTRCEAYQNWLQEPLPPTIAKYKRQLLRSELARELQAIEEDVSKREATAKLLKWAYDCTAGLIPSDDLAESGILRFALVLASGLQQDGANKADTAVSVLKLLDAIVGDDSSVSVLRLPSSGDVKTNMTALLRLAETLKHSVDRTKALTLLCGLTNSKQSVHVAIHKCSVLENWTRLRDANASAVDVLVVLNQLLHRLMATSFPLFLPIVVKTSVVRGAVSTFARHFKQPTVASACCSIFTLLCTASDLCVDAMAPLESGLSMALVNAVRHYSQEPSADATAVSLSLVAIVFCICRLDVAFAKAMDAAKIPSLISRMAANPARQVPVEHARYFDPKQFRKNLVERPPIPAPLTLNVPSSSSSSLSFRKSTQLSPALNLTATPVDEVDIKRACAARFGVLIKLKHRHQFCLVSFLIPQEPSEALVRYCRVVVTSLGTRTQFQTYAFPANNTAYSIAVLRRELVHPTSSRARCDARCDFFRSLFPSLQLIRSQIPKS